MGKNILVQIADPNWTTQTLHLASALARNADSSIIFLHMILTRNPVGLGAHTIPPPTWEQYDQLQTYKAICEEYGVECLLQPMEYASFAGAIYDAVIALSAGAVFIKEDTPPFGLINRLKSWWLKRLLSSTNCQLYMIKEPTSATDPVLISTPSMNHQWRIS